MTGSSAGACHRAARFARTRWRTMAVLFLRVAVGALPAALRNIEDDAVRILEFALEIAVAFVAEVEEEFTAVLFDALLRFGKVVDLETEMMRADNALRVLEAGRSAAGAGGEIKQRQIDDAVAHIDGRAD